MKLIYLEWVDAHSNASWFTESQVNEWVDCDWTIKEAGWLIKETKEYLVFATSWKPDDEFTEAQYCNLHKIPKTWIRYRKELKV